MARGQFILEFLMFLGIAVFVGLVYLAFAASMYSDVSERQRAIAMDDLGFRIQDEMLLAEAMRDGYMRNITLPARLDRFQYTVASDNTSLTLTSGRIILTYPLPAFNGTFQKGAMLIRKHGQVSVAAG